MSIRTQESLSGFIASDPQLTYTERGDARFYARYGQENFQREEDGTFTKLEPSFGNLVLYRATAERAFERFTKGDQFVAKKIGHDTARTRYDVDRTPRQALERQAAGQAFEPPQHHQATPAADSLSM